MIVDEVLLTIKSAIEGLSWLDTESKAMATEKVQEMIALIGYPILNVTALDALYSEVSGMHSHCVISTKTHR